MANHLSVESALWSSTSYVMVSKIKAKIQMKQKMSCIHWKSCPHHVGWVIFVLHYSEEISHIRMANMGTEKHELTGREQKRPLNWPFFLKLWPWHNFSTESSDLVQETTLRLWPRAIRTISYIFKMFLMVGKIKACLMTLDVTQTFRYVSECSLSTAGALFHFDGLDRD